MSKAITDRARQLASASCPSPGRRSANGRAVAVTTEGAVRGNGSECPVALACKRAFPGCEPHIEGESPYIILADGYHRPVELSADLIEEIGKFDRGEPSFEGMTIEIIPGGSMP